MWYNERVALLSRIKCILFKITARGDEFMAEVIKRFQRYTLEGNNLVVSVYSKSRIKKLLNATEYPLQEIAEDKLLALREQRVNVFLVKRDGMYFYVEMCEDRLPANHEYHHKCADCKKCYAKPEDEGGCIKVQEGPTTLYMRGNSNFKAALEQAQRIEKYPFITKGIEFWGKTLFDAVFIVIECTKWEEEV